MLISLSSDQVQLWYGAGQVCLPRGGLELTLPQALRQLVQDGHIRKDVFVINGPGSFTNLRVGCLALTMLKDFVPDLSLYTVSKPDLYERLYQQGYIPNLGLIYIGQQKNVWLYDLALGSYEKLSLEQAYQELAHRLYRVDDASTLETTNKLTLSYVDNLIQLQYQDKHCSLNPLSLGFVQTSALHPHYMMEANISTPSI